MHSHYNPGGFPRICAAPAFPPAPKRGTELDSGYSGKRSIEGLLRVIDRNQAPMGTAFVPPANPKYVLTENTPFKQESVSPLAQMKHYINILLQIISLDKNRK